MRLDVAADGEETQELARVLRGAAPHLVMQRRALGATRSSRQEILLPFCRKSDPEGGTEAVGDRFHANYSSASHDIVQIQYTLPALSMEVRTRPVQLVGDGGNSGSSGRAVPDHHPDPAVAMPPRHECCGTYRLELLTEHHGPGPTLSQCLSGVTVVLEVALANNEEGCERFARLSSTAASVAAASWASETGLPDGTFCGAIAMRPPMPAHAVGDTVSQSAASTVGSFV